MHEKNEQRKWNKNAFIKLSTTNVFNCLFQYTNQMSWSWMLTCAYGYGLHYAFHSNLSFLYTLGLLTFQMQTHLQNVLFLPDNSFLLQQPKYANCMYDNRENQICLQQFIHLWVKFYYYMRRKKMKSFLVNSEKKLFLFLK